VIVIGVRIASRVMSFFVSGGEGADPALIASGCRGAGFDRAPRARDGSVGANESVQLVFIQANRTFADATLMTDSAIIRRAPKGTSGARSGERHQPPTHQTRRFGGRTPHREAEGVSSGHAVPELERPGGVSVDE
jgi:hypothetical protein